MTFVRINGQVDWKCHQGSGGKWVGVCDSLKLTVQGVTWADLMESISDTLDAVLHELVASNELPKFLSDRGWQLIGTLPAKPKSIKNVRFDLPFIPAVMGAHDSQRHIHQ